MKTRSVRMDAFSVNAILKERKTQMRCVIKPQPKVVTATSLGTPYPPGILQWVHGHILVTGPAAGMVAGNPYGIPGDRLWVQETWGALSSREGMAVCVEDCEIQYRADLPLGCTDYPGHWPAEEAKNNPDAPKWRPSVHMPRWASRITLEILDVRVERVQDITADDAMAEGWPPPNEIFPQMNRSTKALRWYASLWDSINAKSGHGWDKNDWVWVVEFELMRKARELVAQ